MERWRLHPATERTESMTGDTDKIVSENKILREWIAKQDRRVVSLKNEIQLQRGKIADLPQDLAAIREYT